MLVLAGLTLNSANKLNIQKNSPDLQQ